MLHVSIADAFWLTAYVAIADGLSSVIVGRHGVRRFDIDGLIDIGSFVVLAMVVVTNLDAVRDVVNDLSISFSTRAMWTAYPILDAALLGVVVQAMLSQRLRGLSGVFLVCGADNLASRPWASTQSNCCRSVIGTRLEGCWLAGG